MKPAERRRISRAIIVAVPELYEKGRLLAMTPRGRILRGVYLEDSSDPSRIYLWGFVLPLYAPTSTIAFDLGKRLGGPSRAWSIDDLEGIVASVVDEGVPFFSAASSPEALASWSFLQGRQGPYAWEAKAYSLVAAGDLAEGAQELRRLVSSLAGATDWMTEMKQRADQLAYLAETDPDGAQELLAKWERQSVAALRIQDVP